MSADRLSTTFAALSDPKRRAILARFAWGEASVTKLAEPFEMTLPAVSKHLKTSATPAECDAVLQDGCPPGGVTHFCMRSPEGRDYRDRCVYREVVPPERIVFTDTFADEEGNLAEPARYGCRTGRSRR